MTCTVHHFRYHSYRSVTTAGGEAGKPVEAQQQLLGLHWLPVENDRMRWPSQWSLKLYLYDWVTVCSGSGSTHTNADAFHSDLTLMQRHWAPSATYSHVYVYANSYRNSYCHHGTWGRPDHPICFPATSLQWTRPWSTLCHTIAPLSGSSNTVTQTSVRSWPGWRRVRDL